MLTEMKAALAALELQREFEIDEEGNRTAEVTDPVVIEAITGLRRTIDTLEKMEPVAWQLGSEFYPVKQRRLLINGGGEFPGQEPLYYFPKD